LIDIKNDFNKDVENYINITSNNIYKTKTNYCFEPVPHSKATKTFPRFIKLIIGPSNSGKSYQLAKLCERYKQAFEENNIIYGSVNSLENDVSFKEIKKSIKELDISKTEVMIDVFEEDVKNSLIIFDDLDSNSGSLTLQS
jgi:predicted AAA+ superfamily ATPase